MASFALDLVLWLIGIRGHIPRFDDFRPVPAAPSAGAGHLVRVLAVMAAVFAALSLAVWGTVWIAIHLL
ncbi:MULTISPECIES: hypothetical protein [Bradyrhizobium]|uniref:Uncharacterized protein n=1 Tax=Bradyrhizobium arachidis TaxID=858423 RepID=A0AAE7NPI3_9BRAD|nr:MULTISPECIES: hypothetical protein [Bradyrhizobium]QOG19781.1 hypothetical protein FOM02_22960 [Bradyrhizobium sp. SEMIA]QOZ66259.1 hypothetical protein WN72_07420 [Bradyrhizobium arachidis]UFW50884.1 hypothetical protein BaraCB756_07515 [Bradyrhizobium arachidis]SFV07678.1 hypothetical protein SAMN05192541_113113 [Bradyrhizobium arachidis]